MPYTPKHGSWLNIAEIELSVLSRQCMNDYFENADQLTERIEAWEQQRNEEKISQSGTFSQGRLFSFLRIFQKSKSRPAYQPEVKVNQNTTISLL